MSQMKARSITRSKAFPHFENRAFFTLYNFQYAVWSNLSFHENSAKIQTKLLTVKKMNIDSYNPKYVSFHEKNLNSNF